MIFNSFEMVISKGYLLRVLHICVNKTQNAMSRKRKIIKWSLITFAGLIFSTVLFGVWFMSLLPEPSNREKLKATTPNQLSYLTENVTPYRGKILVVVTSTDSMGASGKPTGYELTELSRPYYVFLANGFEVEIASPLGGEPPVVIDGDDMREYDYAFLNDSIAQSKVIHSVAMKDVNPKNYQAIYFAGGKGAMFDFPNDKHIQSIVREYYESGKVVGAVCHGPAALINVTLTNGRPFIANRAISGFTNEEELFLIPDAKEIFPFLLQDKLIEKGAQFNEGPMYLNTVIKDGLLVTGQNPWSTWDVAESMIELLGYTPKVRKVTTEETSINILGVYETQGFDEAKKVVHDYCSIESMAIDRELLAIHAIVATMQFKVSKSIDLIRLLSFSNSFL